VYNVKSKVLYEDHGQQTIALIFETGDEVMKSLLGFAGEKQLTGSHFTAIGAFQSATLGYFDWDRKDYLRIPIEEQVEVVALIGDVALGPKGEPKVHAHVVLGKRNGTALAGHLLEARVRPTLELILTESPAHLKRMHDAKTGLALIHI
jgi:predicted DNA-binding protein with PD1-like motif